MTDGITIKGLDDFKRLAVALKSEGGGGSPLTGGVRKQLLSELRKAGAPATVAIRSAYSAEMPKSGGLADRLGRAKVGVRTRLAGATVGVSLVTNVPGYDLGAIERGDLRHPVYGHGPWVSQKVPDNVATHAFEALAPEVAVRVDVAIDKVIAEVELKA